MLIHNTQNDRQAQTLSSSTVMVPLLSVSMVLNSWRKPLISSEDRQRATTRNAAFFNLVMPANCSHCARSACFITLTFSPSLCAFHVSVIKIHIAGKAHCFNPMWENHTLAATHLSTFLCVRELIWTSCVMRWCVTGQTAAWSRFLTLWHV